MLYLSKKRKINNCKSKVLYLDIDMDFHCSKSIHLLIYHYSIVLSEEDIFHHLVRELIWIRCESSETNYH